MAESYYPPGSFYFTVQLIGALAAANLIDKIDASFQEVSGLEANFLTEEVVEGGENRFAHRLPLRGSYSNLLLKRGVVFKDSLLAEWAGQTVGSGLSIPILPQNVLVMLLDSKENPLVAWTFVNAWPVRWAVSPLDAMENRVLIETFELSYNYMERVNLGGNASVATKMAQFIHRLKG
ncbi:MAG TPA: phage tail protein [Dongiaceae bacterium]|jgi:phage tail-like protein|nr:phage tail protein [Dongiaceae bacterium]